uniref:DUF4470 domain-containing protein n=1 Tax=Macrostomum lignano TaxID=282301 RepID=A0A1I8FNY0_9PLAT
SSRDMSQDSPALDRHSIETGLGSHPGLWWGFSPALDLQQVWLDANRSEPAQTMLIVGSGDQRHLLTTLARLRRHCTSSTPLKIFVLTASLYCRAMLQLLLCLDTRASVQERAELFLELYGNTLVREQTVDHVTRLLPDANPIGHRPGVLPADCANAAAGRFEISRARHYGEAVCSSSGSRAWPIGKGFDAQLCWGSAAQQHQAPGSQVRCHTQRIRTGDHQMRLVERPNARPGEPARVPALAHQRRGIPASRGAYDASNRTLCSGIVLSVAVRARHARRGYWGHIVRFIEEETEEAGEAKQDDNKVEKLPESSDKGDAFSNSTAHLLGQMKESLSCFSESAVLVVESALYMLELRQDQRGPVRRTGFATFAANISAPNRLRQLDPEKDAPSVVFRNGKCRKKYLQAAGQRFGSPGRPASSRKATCRSDPESFIAGSESTAVCLMAAALAYASEAANGESTASTGQ